MEQPKATLMHVLRSLVFEHFQIDSYSLQIQIGLDQSLHLAELDLA